MAQSTQRNTGDPVNAELSQVASSAALIKNLSGRVKEKYASGIVSIIVAALLALGEEFFVEAQYRCPCRTEEECKAGHTTGLYAVLPVIFSTFIIFVLGFIANSVIKCVCRGGAKHGLTCGDFWFWTVQALVLSLTWLSILTIDGDYFACIRVCSAYNATCEAVELITNRGKLPFTEAYQDAKETSQWAGYIVALIPLGLFSLISCTKFDCQCCKTSCWNWGCKFDEKLSPAEDRKLDKDMEKAVKDLKAIVISQAPSLLQKFNPGGAESVQETRH